MIRAALLLLVLSSCATPIAPVSTATSPWAQDAAFLLAEMETEHPRIDHHASFDELHAAAASASQGTDVLHLAALVGDGHTIVPVYALPGDNAPIPTTRMLPLRFESYDDGLYVTGARSDLADLVGARVTTIGGQSADKALAGAMRFLPHATPGFASEYAPEWLSSDIVLSALGMVDDDAVRIATDRGTRALPLAPPDDEFDWLESRTDGGFADWVAAPVDNRRATREVVREADANWFRITEFRAPDEEAWLAAMGELAEAAKDANKPLVIDARDCPGGNGDLVPDIIAAVKGSPVEREGRLVLAIARRTHSACIMLTSAIRAETKATIVGQPTGDGANHYGETRVVTLPLSGWRAIHSSKFWQTGEAGDMRDHIDPDVTLPFVFGRDALDAWIKEINR